MGFVVLFGSGSRRLCCVPVSVAAWRSSWGRGGVFALGRLLRSPLGAVAVWALVVPPPSLGLPVSSVALRGFPPVCWRRLWGGWPS